MPQPIARGAVLHAFGEPLRIEEFSVPAVEPGGALISIVHGGVCGTDVHLAAGHMDIPTPLILGHEAVGTVAALGEGLSTDAIGAPLRVGDLVTWASSIPCGRCFYCVSEKEFSLCEQRAIYGINQPVCEERGLAGGWGEIMALRAGSTVIKIPDGVTAAEAIALGCAGPTVVHGLVHIARPQLGETVLVQGSGPVGLAAAMYSKLCGAGRVVLVGGPRRRLDLALTMGACDVVIDIFAEADVEGRIAHALDETPAGRGADLVVEATGVPSAVDEGIRMCRRNGRYLVVGQYTDHGPTPINPHLITRKQLRVLGSWAFAGEHSIDYVRSLPKLAERFDLATLVRQYTLPQVNDALADMRAGEVLKPVISPAAGAAV